MSYPDIEFQAWPKTPRIFKEPMVITEKIDGTNAAIGVVELGEHPSIVAGAAYTAVDGVPYALYAQSRSRLISPDAMTGKGSDNYGFAAWVHDNAADLARVLGPGLHFGEWWGLGINRGYDLNCKRFSLFNTHRWHWLAVPQARHEHEVPFQLDVVPVLSMHTLDTTLIRSALDNLAVSGSVAAPGFMRPEGICVYFCGQTYKYTFDGDLPKGAAKAEFELVAA